MKRAALGFRMHSGWGVLVAVSVDTSTVEILDRRRIGVTEPTTPGAIQPYHYAAHLELAESEKYLARCATESERLALAAVRAGVAELGERNYRIVGSAILVSSGHTLPPLARILAAHPLIHTAEGKFFGNAVGSACERLKISVTAIPVRELDERAMAAFGKAGSRIQHAIAGLGKSIGPPWTKDHKAAALAASIILARE